jgi:hypothetical protein
MSDTTIQLDTCGCCAPGYEPLPAHYNRSGLPQISYRIGTHSDFLRRMLHLIPYVALPNGDNAGSRPLLGLTTRSTDDPAIALIDAWALSLDVLTFYQERIANEGYLRTSAERRSVLELARAIGYELNPGVAASTYLAFTLDTADGSPASVTIARGTRAMNIPVQDKPPQKFETVEEIEARPEWNLLRPRMRATAALTSSSSGIDLDGTATNLVPGDMILITGDERDASPASDNWFLLVVASVTLNSDDDYTTISWERPLGEIKPGTLVTNPRVYAMRLRTALFGYNAPDWKTLPQSVRGNYGNGSDWENMKVPVDGPFDLAAVFPKILSGGWMVLTGDVEITSRGMVNVERETRLYKASEVTDVPRVDFTLNASATHILTDRDFVGSEVADGGEKFLLRSVQVFAVSEELDIAESPATAPVEGVKIELDGIVLGLTPGRKIVIGGKRPRLLFAESRQMDTASGDTVTITKHDNVQLLEPIERIDSQSGGAAAIDTNPDDLRFRVAVRMRGGIAGVVVAPPDITGGIIWQAAEAKDPTTSEVAEIDSVTNDNIHTTITLKNPLVQAYDRASTVLLGNVAAATHGQTIDEVLGSGDGSSANQRFNLKKPPLTYTAAVNASGSQSTLEVRVNDVLWKEVPYLYGRGKRDEVYIARINNDGTTSVIFGDGSSGARLPSGADNITAHYRSGIGPDGEVSAETITVAQNRPLGVKQVTNPVAATGSAEPEAIDDARRNAPNTVLTFDRVVSLRDFEDFSRAFAGIAKAKAAILWNGSQELVHITVAGNNGMPAADPLRRNLAASIDALRDPSIDFTVNGFEPRYFDVRAKVVIDPRYLRDKVIAAIEAMLVDNYSFARRTFGQNVSSSEVIASIQRVDGVVAVDLDHLDYTPEAGGGGAAVLNDVLLALDARWGARGLEAAQLLLINPSGITIKPNEERA